MLKLLEQKGLTLKKDSRKSGGQYSGPCPFCGGNDRFVAWPEQNDTGRFWCRSCGKSGDGIQLFRELKDDSFSDALNYFNVKREFNHKTVSQLFSNNRTAATSTSEKLEFPSDQWQKVIGSIVERVHNFLLKAASKQRTIFDEKYLKLETIRKHKIGWIHDWKEVSIQIDDADKTIWLSPGMVIPVYREGKLVRVKIRSFEDDAKYKYLAVSGSKKFPMLIDNDSRIYIVVESETDALLVDQETGSKYNVIALGSAHIKPDESLDSQLQVSELILISLDNDGTGKERSDYWIEKYSQARYFPPVFKKDHGEMFKAGISINAWITAGIKKYHIIQPETITDSCIDDDSAKPEQNDHDKVMTDDTDTAPDPDEEIITLGSLCGPGMTVILPRPRRQRRNFPRVADCRYFQRDRINPAAGWGSCKLKNTPCIGWPFSRASGCENFDSISCEEDRHQQASGQEVAR